MYVLTEFNLLQYNFGYFSNTFKNRNIKILSIGYSIGTIDNYIDNRLSTLPSRASLGKTD